MMFVDKSGRWDKNRNYALGKTISLKCRDLIDRKPPSGTYVSIDWGTYEVVSKVVAKIIRRWRQSIKNYKMVSRLKNREK